jgi:hypothetical protein
MTDTTRQADAAAGAPEMPEPVALVTSLLGDYVGFTQPKGMRMRKRDPIYTADQMQAYRAAGAEHARRVALEEAAKLCDDVDEPSWHGYECPNTFQDGRAACAAAIRAAAQTQGGT